MDTKKKETEICGIIMPISGSENYTSDHWIDVKNILEEVIVASGFTPNIVSDADEIGIIHNRIVSNIYNNPIIVCDVSSKNPNVMFELGLRLAFDKATIIIKDDITNYNFDTASIEHLTYPKDLRYSLINKFKNKLQEKISSTYAASKRPEYSTFLKNFVQYKSKLAVEEVSPHEYILKQLDTITKQLSNIQRSARNDFGNFQRTTLEMTLLPVIIEFINSDKNILKTIRKEDVFDMFLTYISRTNRLHSVIQNATVTDVERAFSPIYDVLLENYMANSDLSS